MLGGNGVSGYSSAEYILEGLFGIRAYDFTKKNFGNSTYSLFFIFTLPFLRNTQLYFDGYFEDAGWANIKRGDQFTRDLAFTTGMKIPRLSGDGRFSLASEVVKTTQITYRNTLYTDGYTYNGNIMGHPIGPDAIGSYTRFSYMPSLQLCFDLDFGWQRHGRTGMDQFSAPLDSSVFDKAEDRYFFTLGLSKSLHEKLDLVLRTGYQRIENYNFKSGIARNSSTLGMHVNYKF
jgi:hypothetical protein